MNLIGGDIAGIVIYLQQEGSAVHFVQRQLIGRCGTGFDLRLGALEAIDILTVNIKQSDCRHILVISNRDVQRVIHQTDCNVLQFRGSIIHHHRHGESCAGAKLLRMNRVLRIHIVLGNQRDANFQFGSFGDFARIRSEAAVHRIVCILPGAAIDIVVCGCQGLTGDTGVQIILSAVGILHLVEGCR